MVTKTTTSSSAQTSSTNSSPGKFRWLGVDESGAEFGSNSYPGTYGKDFIFPDNNVMKVRSQLLTTDGYSQQVLSTTVGSTLRRIQHLPRAICYGAYGSIWAHRSIRIGIPPELYQHYQFYHLERGLCRR